MSNPDTSPTETQLTNLIHDMERFIKETRANLNEAHERANRTRQALVYQDQMMDTWTKRLEKAQTLARNDLTREAQRHLERHTAFSKQLREECASHEDIIARFQNTVSECELKVEAAKVRIELLWARKNRELTHESAFKPTQNFVRALRQFDSLIHELEAEMDIDQELASETSTSIDDPFDATG